MDSAQFLIDIETQMKGGENAVTNLNKLEKSMKGTGLTSAFANTHIFALRRAVDHLGGPVGKVLGPIFRFGEGLHKMAKQGGAMGLATGGALIAGGAIAELAAKFAEGAAAAIKFGFATADAARDQALTLQAMLGSESAGDALADSFVSVQKATGATSEHLMQLTGELENAHLSGADMATALNAIATQEAAIGTGKTAALVAQLNSGQVSANQLANTISGKFGGIVKDKMMGLSQQAKVFGTNIEGLFGGLKIDGFLAALQKMIGLLDENTASGKAIKFLFETVFQPLVNAATTALPYIELAVLRFINTILKMYIAIKPTIRSVEKLFNITPGQGIQTALAVGTVAAYVFAGAIALVGAALALTALPFVIFGTAIYGVVQGIKKIPAAINAVPALFHRAVAAIGSAFAAAPGLIGDAITAAIDFIKNLPNAVADIIVDVVNIFDAGINALPDAVDAVVSTISAAIDAIPGIFTSAVNAIGDAFAALPGLLGDAVDFVTGLPAKFAAAGEDIIDGLVAAIKNGAAKVIAAVENLGKDAVKAAKKVFHIASPSKAFYEIGTMNTEGLARGHEDGSDRVQSSIDSMTDLPESSPLKRGRRGDGPKFFVTIYANGANAKEQAREIRRELEDLLDETAIELGSGSEATA